MVEALALISPKVLDKAVRLVNSIVYDNIEVRKKLVEFNWAGLAVRSMKV